MSANIKTWQERAEALPLAMRNDERPFMREEIADLRAALAAAERDAARFVFEHTNPETMLRMECKALCVGETTTIDWWRSEIDAAMSTQEQGDPK